MASEDPLAGRRRRAVALIGAATVVIIACAGLYLHSTASPEPNVTETIGIDRTIVSSDPITYDFITPTLGWAAVNPGTRNGSSGAVIVFKTIDGARHWQQELVERTSPSSPASLRLQFVDEKHGFLAAGTPFGFLYRTSDGGTTWTSMPLPGSGSPVIGMHFTDASVGWVLTRGETPALYATADAGSTWRDMPGLPQDAVDLGIGRDAEIWMGSNAPGWPHVYVSTDGGQSWRREDMPQPPGVTWDTGSGPGAQLGVPFVRSDIELLPSSGAVAAVDTLGGKYQFVSLDDGATWRYIAEPPGTLGFADSSHWWAMKGTSLFKSSDGGDSWMVVTKALPDWQFSPHLMDQNHAWADLLVVGGYGVAMTQDGGLHWTRGRVPVYN